MQLKIIRLELKVYKSHLRSLNDGVTLILFQVNHLCQSVLRSTLPMGGMQVIVIGDFYQLAPVPNRWSKDVGEYAFMSSIWPHLIPHKIVLTNIQRQHDDTLITTINETARGCPSACTVEFIKTKQ